MRMRVRDTIGNFASSAQAGWRLVELIEPILASGEEVVLDFADVGSIAAVFFNHSIGALVEKDTANRLPQLLRWENLPELDERILGRVVENAVRRREDPRYAEACEKAAMKFAERD